MAQTLWCGDAQELAVLFDQILKRLMLVGMSFDFRAIYCCSPCDRKTITLPVNQCLQNVGFFGPHHDPIWEKHMQTWRVSVSALLQIGRAHV